MYFARKRLPARFVFKACSWAVGGRTHFCPYFLNEGSAARASEKTYRYNMKQYNLYIFVIYLLFILLHIQAFSHITCSLAFSRETEFLSLAEKAEDLLARTETLLARTRGSADFKSKTARLQFDIKQQIDRMFNEEDFSPESLLKLKDSTDILKNILDEKPGLSKKIGVNGTAQSTLTLVSLKEDPSIIQEDVPYRIDGPHHPQLISVVFGRKIVASFFRSEKDVDRRIVLKNLNALQAGYAGKHSDAGIKLLTFSGNSPHKIFEIKTIGKGSGHIRWGGFKYAGVYYVVHSANNTHHTGYKHAFAMALIEQLRKFHSGALLGSSAVQSWH